MLLPPSDGGAAEELEKIFYRCKYRKTCRSASQGTKQGPWLQFLRLLLKCGIENMAVCVLLLRAVKIYDVL